VHHFICYAGGEESSAASVAARETYGDEKVANREISITEIRKFFIAVRRRVGKRASGYAGGPLTAGLSSTNDSSKRCLNLTATSGCCALSSAITFSKETSQWRTAQSQPRLAAPSGALSKQKLGAILPSLRCTTFHI
jgi:hypothetical protein